jgi:hypothetical protein
MGYAVALIVGMIAGVLWGRWTLERSLVIDADDPLLRTPQNIAGRFWYLIPEKEYVDRFRCPE